MPKRPPFDTHLNFPPPPPRALVSTPLDGIIGAPAPTQAPPPEPAPLPVESLQPDSTQGGAPMAGRPESGTPGLLTAPPISTRALAPIRGLSETPEPGAVTPESGDDGKVTVKLPPELKNRLYNAIYHERGTVGDYLTRAVDDLMDSLERERGGPFPQRPPSDAKFRAGRRAN